MTMFTYGGIIKVFGFGGLTSKPVQKLDVGMKFMLNIKYLHASTYVALVLWVKPYGL